MISVGPYSAPVVNGNKIQNYSTIYPTNLLNEGTSDSDVWLPKNPSVVFWVDERIGLDHKGKSKWPKAIYDCCCGTSDHYSDVWRQEG